VDALKLRLSRRQRQVLLALYRGRAFGEHQALSVRALVERRDLADSRYAGPLAGLEEAGLVAGHRGIVKTNWQSFTSWWLTDEGRGAARALGASRPALDAERATVRVLQADEALGAGLAPHVRAEARERAIAETLVLEAGAWTPEVPSSDWRGGLGLLVLEGLISRQVMVKRRTSLELLGPGDLLRPWSYPPGLLSSVSVPATWEVLTAARLAVLDRQFAARSAPWPEVTGVLLDRAVQRSRLLAVQSAVRQGGPTEERLLLMLWHLAHRWGEFDRDGVALRLRGLSPAVLARMAATSRAAAAGALDRLQAQGRVEQLEEGGWWLALRQLVVGPDGASPGSSA
jgi:CRP/FNR family transcriptional regulator, cyclic AMP receptor protein